MRRKTVLVAGTAFVVVAGLLAGGLALKGANDRQIAETKMAKAHTASR